MPLFSSSLARYALFAAAGFLLVQACGASTDSPDSPSTGGGGGFKAGTGGAHVVMPDAGLPEAGERSTPINPLCGVEARLQCQPDDLGACLNFSAPAARLEVLVGGAGAGGADAEGVQAGVGGVGGVGGAGAVGGEAGGPVLPPFPVGGAGGVGDGGAPNTGEGGSGGADGPPTYACRVSQVARQPEAACGLTGRGLVDAPCLSGGDCGAGLACVALGSVSRCRPYCCKGEEACKAGSYCAERPLVDSSVAKGNSALVPACIPADNCDLTEPYPCPGDKVCQCPAETACRVVRADGTTSCMPPEGGQLGDACPCAYGFVCSQGTQSASCVKLCTTNSDLLPCPSGRCQVATELPKNIGICITE